MELGGLPDLDTRYVDVGFVALQRVASYLLVGNPTGRQGLLTAFETMTNYDPSAHSNLGLLVHLWPVPIGHGADS